MLVEVGIRIKEKIAYIALFLMVTAFVFLVFFSFLKQNMMMNSGVACMADFIDSISYGSFFNILITPLSSCFIVIITSMGLDSSESYVRNKSRLAMIINKNLHMIFLSVFISVFMILIAVLTAGLFSTVQINWIEQTSYFYKSTGVVLSENFLNIMFFTFIKLLFPICFFSIFINTLSLKINQVLAFLFGLCISASGFMSWLKIIIQENFSVNSIEGAYLDNSSKLLLFIVFPILIFLVFLLSIRFIKKKDFL